MFDGMFLYLPLSDPVKGLKTGISLLSAGDMGPSWQRENGCRRTLFSGLNISVSSLVCLRQEHTRLVHDAREPVPADGSPGVGDGLLTADPGLVLGVTVADCLPIFLYAEKTGAFGLVHSGWKGTGIALEAVRRLTSSCGLAPRDVRIHIGPGIGACCYRVDSERAETFARAWGAETVRASNGGQYLDLREANIRSLQGAGVQHITVSKECTCCTPRFGSYRRQGPDAFTRMIALIGFF